MYPIKIAGASSRSGKLHRRGMLDMTRACLSVLLCSVAFGGTIVVPNAETSIPGNSGVGGPISPTPAIAQFLYASGQFTGPIEITQISFRASPGTGPADFAYGNMSAYLSTSPNSTTTVSTTFANNIGPDNTLVFSGTNVVLGDAGCSGSGVCPFDLSINLSTPFYYNPANGSLLLEIVATALEDLNDGNSYFDPESFSGPGAMALVYESGSTTATTGAYFDEGNVTKFTFTAVPEPSSWTMTAIGVATLLGIVRRRPLGRRP
jgi:hypothetical protein